MTQTPTATLPALQVLIPGKQWVVFNQNKIPFTPNANPETSKSDPAAADNPDTWGTYSEAKKAKSRSSYFKGIGREFLKEQGITGIDLDKCIDEQGNLTPYAQDVVTRFNSYTEISPSGRGLHIWVHGSLTANIPPCKPEPDGIEAYDHERYFTITGKHYPGTPTKIEPRQAELTALYEETIARREAARDREKPRKTESASRPGADTPYGLKALDDECSQIARTGEGARNDQLNRSAYAIGQLIAGEELAENTARRELEAAAERAGLAYREIQRTLRSGIEKGMKEPRSAPEKLLQRTQEYRPMPDASTIASNGNGNHTHETPDTGKRGRAFNRTDFGNAERLVARYGDRLRYCHAMNNWIVWSETQWKEDKDGQAERLAKDTVRSIYAEAADEADEADRKAIATHGIKSESKARIRDMLILAQSEHGIPVRREDLDANPWLLNCSNGTLDLRTGELRPHNRADLLTKCLATPYIPDAPRPRWESFLDTIFNGNTKLITFMQRAFGYALTGDTSEQCFFLLYGPGQNGKSTLLEAIQTVLEDYAQAAEFKAFLARDNEGIRNDIARMNGKRMVIAKETDKGRRLAEALVKQLTGGDTITARFLHQEYFDFRPQFKLFLAANHKPEIKGTDLGIWRRVRLIPFTVTISDSQKDKDLPRKLAEEAPGILAWLAQGCLDWQRYGLGVPEEVRTATDSYRSEMDVIARFLSENCDIAEKSKVTSSDLLAAYKAWCEDNGERYDAKQLRTILLEKGFECKRSTGGRFAWHGITLKSEPTPGKSEPAPDQFERKSEPSEPSEPKNGNFAHEGQNNEKLPKNASLGSLVHFSEDEQKAWLIQFTNQPRVTTAAGPGVILDTTPLPVQVKRNRIGVILDATNEVQYFNPTELQPCTLPMPKRQKTWSIYSGLGGA